MADAQNSVQSVVFPAEGLAFTWDASPDAQRYGLVVGAPGLEMPAFEAIMNRGSRAFAILPIPNTYTGAAGTGWEAGQEWQVSLIIVRSDLSVAPGIGLRVQPVSTVARDRLFYPLRRPDLERPAAPIAAAARPVEQVKPSPAEVAFQPIATPDGSAGTAAGGRDAGGTEVAGWRLLEQPPAYQAPAEEGGAQAPAAEHGGARMAAPEVVPVSPVPTAVTRRDDSPLAAAGGQDTPPGDSVGRPAGPLAAPPRDLAVLEAEAAMRQGDHWGALDIFERLLDNTPANEEARRGASLARTLASWATTFAAAGGDAARLAHLGAECLDLAPAYAAQAYAAAFAERPTADALCGWLLALARSGRQSQIAEATRQGVKVMSDGGIVFGAPAMEALRTLGREPSTSEAMEQAIAKLRSSLASR